ncbi:hypothetical protein CBR_g32000 [Chara braunii]|uniref:Protein kinase domain-containing protein n=1 Tax=Chara braunii TaxID=69332 RepID=A0A388LG85_CHABU|nr:hypothetical protein CBR_g32000 [Chara braunii]|eukprot:GBG81326.1 hypothetical protein CBR_g32000 [Chara braunii]
MTYKPLGKRVTSGSGLVDLVRDNNGGADHSSIPEWEIDNTELDFHNSRIIGRGAFGVVQIAVWRGTKVAVKKILRSLEQDQHTIRDFQEEVSLLPLLRHPNIVQFMGAVTLNPPLMLVTEYLPKGDLFEMLSQEKHLNVPQILRYTLDIARGMNYLHSHKPEAIVHRDLKPRNLLLGDGGHLKVADFGLSKLIHQGVEKYQMTGETGSFIFNFARSGADASSKKEMDYSDKFDNQQGRQIKSYTRIADPGSNSCDGDLQF